MKPIALIITALLLGAMSALFLFLGDMLGGSQGLVVGFLFAAFELAHTAQARDAFRIGMVVGWLCYAPQLLFFWTIFSFGAVFGASSVTWNFGRLYSSTLKWAVALDSCSARNSIAWSTVTAPPGSRANLALRAASSCRTFRRLSAGIWSVRNVSRRRRAISSCR